LRGRNSAISFTINSINNRADSISKHGKALYDTYKLYMYDSVSIHDTGMTITINKRHIRGHEIIYG